MKKVTIYTTTTCLYCKMAKEFFAEHAVAYEEHNVGSDVAAREEMLALTGQLGVPVIVIRTEGEGSEKKEPIVIIGFDKKRLMEALEIAA